MSLSNKRIINNRAGNRLANDTTRRFAKFGLNVFTCCNNFTNVHALKLSAPQLQSGVLRLFLILLNAVPKALISFSLK